MADYRLAWNGPGTQNPTSARISNEKFHAVRLTPPSWKTEKPKAIVSRAKLTSEDDNRTR